MSVLNLVYSELESAPYAKVQARQSPHKAPPTWGQGKGKLSTDSSLHGDDMETRGDHPQSPQSCRLSKPKSKDLDSI